MHVMRLCKRAHAQLDGLGASLIGGRWNSPGNAVVYSSSTTSLSVVEYLVHLRTLPDDMVLLDILIPETLMVESAGWAPPDVRMTRSMGDSWFNSKKAPVLRVPSVIVPGEYNFLLNTQHPLFPAIIIDKESPFAFDTRLLGAVNMSINP